MCFSLHLQKKVTERDKLLPNAVTDTKDTKVARKVHLRRLSMRRTQPAMVWDKLSRGDHRKLFAAWERVKLTRLLWNCTHRIGQGPLTECSYVFLLWTRGKFGEHSDKRMCVIGCLKGTHLHQCNYTICVVPWTHPGQFSNSHSVLVIIKITHLSGSFPRDYGLGKKPKD